MVPWKPPWFPEGPGSVHQVLVLMLVLICSLRGKGRNAGFGIVSSRFWSPVLHKTFRQGIYRGMNQLWLEKKKKKKKRNFKSVKKLFVQVFYFFTVMLMIMIPVTVSMFFGKGQSNHCFLHFKQELRAL